MLRKALDHIEEIVLVPGFALMLLINFGNVLSRYVLHTSWAFTEELCVMMFVYVTFFGAAVAVKRHQHLGFTLILDKLPKPARIIMDTIITISVCIFMGIMIYYGIKVCQNQLKHHAVTAALRISTVWSGLSIPVGGAFILARTVETYIRDTIANLKAMKKGA